MSDTATQLEKARNRLAVLDAEWERTGLPKDPGALSGVKGRTHAHHVKSIRRTTQIASESVALQATVRRLEAKLRTEHAEAAQNAAATVDLDSLQPGDLIRYEHRGRSLNNWARVVRVNAKTVTCMAAPGMDRPKIPRDRIVETRKAAEG